MTLADVFWGTCIGSSYRFIWWNHFFSHLSCKLGLLSVAQSCSDWWWDGVVLIWVRVFSFFLLSSLWRSVCISLLSLHAPISDPERQATGSSSQTGRQAELPNHIPSLPTTVSISLLSSQPSLLHTQCWKQAWGGLRWWFSLSLPGTLGFPQELLRPPIRDAHRPWLCMCLTFSGFTSHFHTKWWHTQSHTRRICIWQVFRRNNLPRVFSFEDLHAALRHHGNLRLIVLTH